MILFNDAFVVNLVAIFFCTCLITYTAILNHKQQNDKPFFVLGYAVVNSPKNTARNLTSEGAMKSFKSVSFMMLLKPEPDILLISCTASEQTNKDIT